MRYLILALALIATPAHAEDPNLTACRTMTDQGYTPAQMIAELRRTAMSPDDYQFKLSICIAYMTGRLDEMKKHAPG